MKLKFTPSLWETILGFTVIDPDGWDRKTSWSNPLTLKEFLDRADQSTTTFRPGISYDEYKNIALRRLNPNIPNYREELEKMI